MQRMHSFVLKAGLAALLINLVLANSSTAALLRPNDTREYPDVTAFANGYQTYHYDAASQTGNFSSTIHPIC